LTRPFDKHLDIDELDGLLSLQRTGVSDSEQISEQSLREAQHHVESCQDCRRNLQMHRYVPSEIFRMRAPTPSPPTPECIGDAEWLEVAAGLLPDAKTRELMKHAAQCGHCGPLLKNAAEALVDETTPREEAWLASLRSAQPEWRKNMAETLRRGAGAKDSSREKKGGGASWWQALFSWSRPAFALAAIALVVVAGWLALLMLRPPSAEQLLAQAYTEHRTLEVRIPGAKYAPMRVERATGGSSLDKSPSLLRAEALIGENLRKNPNDPMWLQAKARADLLDGNFESAIKSLQRALETQPDSPGLLTDLASAYFLRAESADRPIDYGNAIESLGKALAKSPDDPVALFNQALACERMFLYTQAVDDWEHYLRVDPQGEWAEDARKRLAVLKERLQQHEKSQVEPLLEPSYIARADAEHSDIRDKIDERIEDYLSLAVTDWLPRAYPTDQQAATKTSDLRSALTILSEVTTQKHADRWLMDLLSSSLSANFAHAIKQLSAASQANDTGDNVAARQHAAHAEQLFISSGSDAGALLARVEYIFASHDAQEGAQCLEAANGVASRLRDHSFEWLTIQFYLEQGTCYWFAGNLGETHQLYRKAASTAERSGYGTIYLRTQDHLSSLGGASGNLPESWIITRQALGRFWSGHYPPMRGYNLYYNLYEFARIVKQPFLQMAAWRDGVTLSESFSDNVLRAMAHSLMASAAVAAEQTSVADREFTRASELFALAPQVDSARIARVEAETRLAEVETTEGRAQAAVSRLQRLEPEVSQLSDDFLSILFYTTLGNAKAAVGGGKEAESALRSAVEMSELLLQSLHDERSRAEWNRRTSNTYRNLAELRLRRGDAQGALEIWEWYRGAALRGRPAKSNPLIKSSVLPEPHEVATLLPALLHETFVSYALLPRGLAIWSYDDRGVSAHWIEGNPGDIEARVNRFRNLCADPKSEIVDLQRNAHALYDLLANPIEQHLSSDRTLVIELDDGLAGLPFDALLDAQNHYLSDHGPIVSSLGIYFRLDGRAHVPITADLPALVAAVPASKTNINLSMTLLPDTISEGEIVAHGFSAAHLLAGNDATAEAVLSQLPEVSVFHFAGHAISSSQQSGLLLSDALLSASSLEKISLSRMQLAVFSACGTQGGSAGIVTDDDSLVRTFLRAGVPHVVASRWSVDSIATRQFMELFYRALLTGNTVAESIHIAQYGLRSRPGMAHPYYWSAFAAFGAV
jgi:CHAT domain-containing protein/cytochrome c-type biogenesis protein CcmH/NrfG